MPDKSMYRRGPRHQPLRNCFTYVSSTPPAPSFCFLGCAEAQLGSRASRVYADQPRVPGHRNRQGSRSKSRTPAGLLPPSLTSRAQTISMEDGRWSAPMKTQLCCLAAKAGGPAQEKRVAHHLPGTAATLGNQSVARVVSPEVGGRGLGGFVRGTAPV